jgi:hypothetical protein
VIGTPKAWLVAQACGANTLAGAIPCHHVIRNDGALSGYRWGVERKRALLDQTSQDIDDEIGRLRPSGPKPSVGNRINFDNPYPGLYS